jgi:hypothetical protein
MIPPVSVEFASRRRARFDGLAAFALVLGVCILSLVIYAARSGHAGHHDAPTVTHAPTVAAWAPTCAHFPATVNAVCVANLRVDSWALAGAFDGHAGCWQLTGDALTVFDCQDGRVIVVSTNQVG